MGICVLVVDDNPVNLKVATIPLTAAGYEVFTASNGTEALEQTVRLHPDVILLDITMPDMDGYEVCRRLRTKPETASIPVMMLTSHDTLEEKVRGFEVGADDYMIKPFQPPELVARVRVLLKRAVKPSMEARQAAGKTIAFFSLRGGVGVSTMAANTAVGLAQIWNRPVCLVDMAFMSGQAALILNLPLRNTWLDLASETLNALDADSIEKTMLNHSSGVLTLAAPRSAADGERVTPDLVKKVLTLLREKYDYIVLDLPHDFHETTLVGLDFSNEIVLLMAPELASVRATSGALEVFDKLGYPRQHIQVILNWVFEKRGLARKDIENVLHQPISAVIPFAPEQFVSAINLGSPPILNNQAGPLSALLEDFSYLFSLEADQSLPPASPSEAWYRVMERGRARSGAKK